MKLTISAQSLIRLEEKIHIKTKSLNKILKIHDDEAPWDLTWLLRHGEGGLPLVADCSFGSLDLLALPCQLPYLLCICIFIALSNAIIVLVTVFTSAAKFHNWSACCIWRLIFLVCSGTVILVFPVTYTMTDMINRFDE